MMPTYLYICHDCNNYSSVKQSIKNHAAKPSIPICSNCKNPMSRDFAGEGGKFIYGDNVFCTSRDGYSTTMKERTEYFKRQGKISRKRGYKPKKDYKSDKIMSYPKS